jgi:peptide/nickel transport system ATP-binding protein
MNGILEVDGLTVRAPDGRALVENVSFEVGAGRRLALIGESGSGKSLTSLAVMGLLPEGLTASGSVRVGGAEVVGARERMLNGMRGRRIGIVFQEPLTALDPLATLGAQLAEPIGRAAKAAREHLERSALKRAVLDALDGVSVREPERVARSYPHEVSGGQRQRVAIAMALAARPELLIADEPTTALDVTVQSQVLDLLDRLVLERGMALLFVSHDLAVVARIAPRAVVLRNGREVESGGIGELIARPRDEYTRRLVAAAVELDRSLDFGAASQGGGR